MLEIQKSAVAAESHYKSKSAYLRIAYLLGSLCDKID